MDHALASAKKGTAEARKGRTRAALREAMLALLSEKPFEQIQILDLSTRAHVGYATFFRHYSGTQELLDEVAGDEIHELLGMTIPALMEYDSSVSLMALCRFVRDRRDLWRTLLTGGAAHSVRGEFVRQAREWSRKAGQRDKDVPIDLGTVCAAGSTIDALAWWLERGEVYSIEEMAEFIDRLCIAPFIGGR